MDHIKDKCVWITGATSPLGQALVATLSGQGNFVIVSSDKTAELEKMVKGSGGRIAALPFSYHDSDNASASVCRHLSEITDYLDLVICCTQLREPEDGLRFDPAMYRKTFDFNVVQVINSLNLALPFMRNSTARTQFVVVGSLMGLVGMPRAEGFGASMAALDYFMRALRADAQGLPIDLSLIRLGNVPSQAKYEGSTLVSLPYEIDTEEAVQVILTAIRRRKFLVDYPRKLGFALKLIALGFPLWCRWGAPYLSRLKRQCWSGGARGLP